MPVKIYFFRKSVILKDLDRGAFQEVWNHLNLKDLDRGAFWGRFVTLLILKDLHRGAKGSFPWIEAKSQILKELHRGGMGRGLEVGSSRLEVGRTGTPPPRQNASGRKPRAPYPPSFCKSGAIKDLREKRPVRVVQ